MDTYRKGGCSYCGREDCLVRTEVRERPYAKTTRTICEVCDAGQKSIAWTFALAIVVCLVLVLWFAFSR